MKNTSTTLEIPEGSKAVISGKVIDGKNVLSAVSFNLVWDADITVENDFRSYILGKPIYDMSCNKCLTFIGAYHKPEDCQDKFCHKCGQSLRNG